MRWLKRSVAWIAARLGLLPWLTDAYLYVRSRWWTETSATKGADAAVDGKPLPPASLRFSSSGTADLQWFLESGRRGAGLVMRLAEDVAERPAVLDFGCGSGRVIRHLDALETRRLHGVDWNRRAIRWCRENLAHATFSAGALEPPLDLDGDFDLIYAFSVFTHMPADLQRAWLADLGGRLRPGGRLAISTHGAAFRDQLDGAEREAWDAGRLVVREPTVAGTNICASYHPDGALERLLPEGLAVAAHEPEGAVGNPPQDLWVLAAR